MTQLQKKINSVQTFIKDCDDSTAYNESKVLKQLLLILFSLDSLAGQLLKTTFNNR